MFTCSHSWSLLIVAPLTALLAFEVEGADDAVSQVVVVPPPQPEEEWPLVGRPGVPCALDPVTAACVKGLPEWGVLSDGFWPGMDCLTKEIMSDIAVLGREGVEEWYEICATMPLKEQGGQGYVPQIDGWIQGYECEMWKGETMFVLNTMERDMIIERGATNCVETQVPSYTDPSPCVESSDGDFCTTDARFDFAVFDPSTRPDCGAKSIRDELAFLGMEGLEYYQEECATRDTPQ